MSCRPCSTKNALKSIGLQWGLILSSCSVLLWAQTPPHVTIALSSQTVAVTDTIKVDVGIAQGDSIKSVLLLLNYDESRYRYLSGTPGSLLREPTFYDIHIQNNQGDYLLYLVGVCLGAGRYVSAPGILFELQFIAYDTGSALFHFDSLKFITPNLNYFDGTADSALSYVYPRDLFPPAAVTNFRAREAGSGQLSFTWTNPLDNDFMGVKIWRSTIGFQDTLNAQATLVYNGTGTTFSDVDLKNGTIYYYTARTYDEIPNYSRPVYLKAEPKATYAYFYPNPFSPLSGATIKTIFPYDTEIDLAIYDAVGNLVIQLYKNQPVMANDPTLVLSWDGRNGKGEMVANGVYYCIIKSLKGDKIVEKVAVVR